VGQHRGPYQVALRLLSAAGAGQ